MIHIATLMTRCNTSRFSKFTMHSDQINQTATGPQLYKTQFLNFPFPDAAKHVAIETCHAVKRSHPQHNVIYRR